MANTYVLIQAITVGSGGAASMAFTSIPQTYTDLLVKISPRTTQPSNNGAVSLRFNSSTTTYSGKEVVGDSIGVGTSTRGNFQSGLYVTNICGNTTTANAFGNMDLYIPNYTSSNSKAVLVLSCSENAATESYQTILSGRWANSSAITDVTFYSESSTPALFMQNTTAYLYGISNA